MLNIGFESNPSHVYDQAKQTISEVMMMGQESVELTKDNAVRIVLAGDLLFDPGKVVKILVGLSVKRRQKGVLSLQFDEDETAIAFLKQWIGLIVDGCTKEQIKDSLCTEMYFFRMRRDETGRVLNTMADLAPISVRER